MASSPHTKTYSPDSKELHVLVDCGRGNIAAGVDIVVVDRCLAEC